MIEGDEIRPEVVEALIRAGRVTVGEGVRNLRIWDRAVDEADLFGETGTRFSGNPEAYGGAPGSGPVGKTCGDCRHAVGSGNSRTYWKCTLVRSTSGPGTDIRLRTPACSRFEAEP